MGTYLTLTAGAGFAATAAQGAITVTFYGVNSANDTNPDPAGISVGRYGLDSGQTNASVFSFQASGYFSQGSDEPKGGAALVGAYRSNYNTFDFGAVSGDANYANVSFIGNFSAFEAVAQFHFGAPGEGYLIAIARNDDNSALSISDGKAAIDALPETSSLSPLISIAMRNASCANCPEGFPKIFTFRADSEKHLETANTALRNGGKELKPKHFLKRKIKSPT